MYSHLKVPKLFKNQNLTQISHLNVCLYLSHIVSAVCFDFNFFGWNGSNLLLVRCISIFIFWFSFKIPLNGGPLNVYANKHEMNVESTVCLFETAPKRDQLFSF